MGIRDTRIALKEGASLRFYNHDDSTVTYTIQEEIGRGGSVIVYNASYEDNAGCRNLVRIRECYPFYVNLNRDGAGALIAEERDVPDFQEYQRRMRQSYIVSKELFYTGGLTNFISNTLNLHEANNTLYTVSTYVGGKVLSLETAGSVKDCISLVKATACAIRKLHDKGYLYLDVKPENIFVLEGIREVVQLFDFDTIVPLSEIGKGGSVRKYRVAYSDGYGAYEQQKGLFSQLGKHTDVYGVGALLFYLLFERVPKAPDCEADAEYSYDSKRFAGQHYQDRLFQVLPEFFHHSLAGYYADRYPDMEQVINKLEEIEKYADTVVPFLISSQVNCPPVLVGREAELEDLDAWMNRGETNCLFLTGMGGIGKSSLVKKYIADNRCRFDAVLYLYYNGSVRKMITDDGQLRINIVERRKEESEADYFIRKGKILRDLAAGKRMLLVADNFEGEPDEDFIAVLNIGWKVIAVTREDKPETGYETLRLGTIGSREDMCTMFERYARREIDEADRECVEDIIDRVSGHTLALQLIARQIACSHISVSEAAQLLKERGFGNIAPEKVDYVKDQMLFYEKVSDIITMLFAAGHMEDGERAILKALSLFPFSGVEINVFADMIVPDVMKAPDWLEAKHGTIKDVLNRLAREGWVQAEGGILSIHPVVHEVIRQWEWTEACMPVYSQIICGIWKQIELESRRENYPLKQLRQLQWTREYMEENAAAAKRIKEYASAKGIEGEILLERLAGSSQWKATDHKKLGIWLNMAEGVLDACRKERKLVNTDEYRNLLFCTLMSLPRDRETYILEHAGELLGDIDGREMRFEMTGDSAFADRTVYAERETMASPDKAVLDADGKAVSVADGNAVSVADGNAVSAADGKVVSAANGNAVSAGDGNAVSAANGNAVFDLYDKVITIYEERKELEKAYIQLKNAEKASRRFRSLYQRGQYYMILVGYYDAMIGGAYGDKKHAGMVRRVLRATDQAIHCLKKDKTDDSKILYTRALLSKAQVLNNCYPKKWRKTLRLLERVKGIAETYAQRYSEIWLDYNVVSGWFSTYGIRDYECMTLAMTAADEIARVTADSDLAVVDEVLYPWAEMLCEFGKYEEAAEKLKEGIEICGKEAYQGVVPYIRRKVDLYAFLLDVYYLSGDFEKCREVIGVIDEENLKNQDVGVVKVIAEDYRGEVFGGR